MKLNEHSVEIERSSAFKESKYTMDDKELPLLFKLLRTSMYSNKIGSIVREITSNCVDSHIEAGVTDVPVEIEYIPQDTATGKHESIVFRDFGVGLSPSRMDNVFRKYLSSTKRDSNDQIGGFGLGSKSPFAYTDNFYISTKHNGKVYDYLAMIDESGLGSIVSLHEDTTTDRNGTEIIIPIQKSGDIQKFMDEINIQLAYFDNVRYINMPQLTENVVYHADNFAVSPLASAYSSVHILVGKVPYQITSEELSDIRDISVSMGLKFDIGDVSVTPSREALEFDDATIEAVRKKFEDAKEEIYRMFVKDSESLNGIMDYFTALQFKGNKVLWLDKERTHNVDISKLFSGNKLKSSFQDKKYPTMSGKRFDFIPRDFLRATCQVDWKHYSWDGKSKKDVYSHHDGSDMISALNESGADLRIIHVDMPAKKVHLDYVHRKLYPDCKVAFVKKRPFNLYSVANHLGLRLVNRNKHKEGDETNWLVSAEDRKLCQEYFDCVHEFIDEHITTLSTAIDSDEYVHYEENAKQSNLSALESAAERRARRRANLIITAKTLFWVNEKRGRTGRYSNRHSEWVSPQFTPDEIKLTELMDFKGILIYGFQDDDQDLKNIGHLFSWNRNFRDSDSFKTQALQVIKIAKSNEKLVTLNPRAYHVKHFIKTEVAQKQIKDLVGAGLAFKFVEQVTKLNKKHAYGTEIRNKILKEFYDIHNPTYRAIMFLLGKAGKIRDFSSQLDDEFLQEYFDFAKENGIVDEDVVRAIAHIKQYTDGLDLVYLLDIDKVKHRNRDNDPVKEFLQLKGKKVTTEGRLSRDKNLERKVHHY